MKKSTLFAGLAAVAATEALVLAAASYFLKRKEEGTLDWDGCCCGDDCDCGEDCDCEDACCE